MLFPLGGRHYFLFLSCLYISPQASFLSSWQYWNFFSDYRMWILNSDFSDERASQGYTDMLMNLSINYDGWHCLLSHWWAPKLNPKWCQNRSPTVKTAMDAQQQQGKRLELMALSYSEKKRKIFWIEVFREKSSWFKCIKLYEYMQRASSEIFCVNVDLNLLCNFFSWLYILVFYLTEHESVCLAPQARELSSRI